MLKTTIPEFRAKAATDESASEFIKHFLALGEQLSFAARHLQV
jgi:dimeric dUTPase (all-alpha-NTP-PPase superfamily)